MARLSLALLLITASVVTVISADGEKKRDSLPDAILKSVEKAKTFLRNRKSLNKLSRKRGFEFDEMEEIFDNEEMEESHGRFRISHSRYPNIGHRRYPNIGHRRLPNIGHRRLPNIGHRRYPNFAPRRRYPYSNSRPHFIIRY